MKLIREEIESVDFLVEERNGKKSMYIEGVFSARRYQIVMAECIQWRL